MVALAIVVVVALAAAVAVAAVAAVAETLHPLARSRSPFCQGVSKAQRPKLSAN
jgi:uncharacterized membrane protein